MRTLSDGRHPEHGKTGYTKKHAVDGRQYLVSRWVADALFVFDHSAEVPIYLLLKLLLLITKRHHDLDMLRQSE